MSDTGQKEVRSEEKKKNKALIIIIIIFAIVVIALVGFIAFLLGRRTGEQDSAASSEPSRQVQTSTRLIEDPESAASIIEEMRKEVEEGMFECNMTMTWTFEDGESESKDAYVANSENNTHPIYFDVFLTESEEHLYSSKILPVGTDVKNIKLDRALPAGSYSATVMNTVLKDVESQEPISNAGFIIRINILN